LLPARGHWGQNQSGEQSESEILFQHVDLQGLRDYKAESALSLKPRKTKLIGKEPRAIEKRPWGMPGMKRGPIAYGKKSSKG
jgi:hypothetical protein